MAEEKHRKQRKEMSKLNVMSYEILLIQIYEKKNLSFIYPKDHFSWDPEFWSVFI